MLQSVAQRHPSSSTALAVSLAEAAVSHFAEPGDISPPLRELERLVTNPLHMRDTAGPVRQLAQIVFAFLTARRLGSADHDAITLAETIRATEIAYDEGMVPSQIPSR